MSHPLTTTYTYTVGQKIDSGTEDLRLKSELTPGTLQTHDTDTSYSQVFP